MNVRFDRPLWSSALIVRFISLLLSWLSMPILNINASRFSQIHVSHQPEFGSTYICKNHDIINHYKRSRVKKILISIEISAMWTAGHNFVWFNLKSLRDYGGFYLFLFFIFSLHYSDKCVFNIMVYFLPEEPVSQILLFPTYKDDIVRCELVKTKLQWCFNQSLNDY